MRFGNLIALQFGFLAGLVGTHVGDGLRRPTDAAAARRDELRMLQRLHAAACGDSAYLVLDTPARSIQVLDRGAVLAAGRARFEAGASPPGPGVLQLRAKVRGDGDSGDVRAARLDFGTLSLDFVTPPDADTTGEEPVRRTPWQRLRAMGRRPRAAARFDVVMEPQTAELAFRILSEGAVLVIDPPPRRARPARDPVD